MKANVKSAIKVIEAAESAGFRLAVDPADWTGPASAFPLDEEISPVRCELVAEARRLAESLDRPESPPDGCVYRHGIDEIAAAVVKAASHIKRAMKGKSNDQRTEDRAQRDEPTDGPAAEDGEVSGSGGGAVRGAASGS